MRALTFSEQHSISGANSTRIEPNFRLFSDEFDRSFEFDHYIRTNYGSHPQMGLVNSLPYTFYQDMAELYYRSVSTEDAFWRNSAGILGAMTCIGIGFAIGKII